MKTSLYSGLMFCLLMSLDFTAMASDSERVFTYVGDAKMVPYNTKRSETVSLAMRIDNPSLMRKKVVRIRAKIDNSIQNVTNCSLWLSKELNIKTVDGKKVNDPDIYSHSVVPDSDGCLDCKLDSPFILGRDGIYVGYTLTIPDYNKDVSSPIIYSQDRHAGGFYFLSSIATVKWMDYENNVRGVVPIYVTFEGDFKEYEVGITEWNTSNPLAQSGSDFSLPLKIYNMGDNDVSELEYSYFSGDYSGSGKVELAQPIAPSITNPSVVNLDFKAAPFVGQQNMKVKIEKVDGNVNEGVGSSASLPVEFRNFVPVQRVLLEEATGSWCSACPRGSMAIDVLHRMYGTRFVAAAYHGGNDPMATIFETPFDNSFYPSASLNRGGVIDPYYGDDKSQNDAFHINEMIGQLLDVPASAGIELKANWSDESCSSIKAEAKVAFVSDTDESGYKVEFILLSDGLRGNSRVWFQSNAYNDRDVAQLGEVLAPLHGMGNPIIDMEYDHVVVVAKHDAVALPSTMDADIFYDVAYLFDASEAVSNFVATKDESLIQNTSNVVAVALLLNKDGKVVNCVSTPVGTDYSSVNIIENNTHVVSSEYFDYMGRKVNCDFDGFCIVREKLSDGTFRTKKFRH